MAAILNSAIFDSAILHKTLTQTISICLKLIPSHKTWWWSPAWILPSWIQPFYTKKLHLFILTQLYDGTHLQFGHLEISHLSFSSQTHPHLPRLVPTISKKKKLHSLFPLHHWHKILHSFNLINLMMASILNSAILDSAILNKTLTQTNSIWLKLLHCHSTWWWQPSWIWPSWIQPS